MSDKKYVLRANFFGYNDEYYNLYKSGDGGKLCGVYDDLESAMVAWKQLEYKTLQHRPLANIQEFFERTEEQLRVLDKFVLERVGESIIDGHWVMEDSEAKVAKMNPDQVFEFLEKADLLSYHLAFVPFDVEQKFYIGWLPEQNSYFYPEYDGDESASPLAYCYYRSRAEEVLENYICNSEGLELHGSLAELSHTPEILRTLIQNEPRIDYDEHRQVLSIGPWETEAFKKLYPLLANPPLEIREVSLDEVQALIAQSGN